jgi:hypothetical protein
MALALYILYRLSLLRMEPGLPAYQHNAVTTRKSIDCWCTSWLQNIIMIIMKMKIKIKNKKERKKFS